MKVFLAEDEFVVREGIKNNIDWKGHGYEFCGEAGDGEMAYSMIPKSQPDILIADIKMPFMDGLSLSRLIKSEFPAIEIILLTGYEEFAFAQEAIQIGVSRYLSKPISGDNLLKEIDIVAEKIREREEERSLARKYAAEMEEREQLEKQEFFRNLVTGEKELSEILEDSRKLNIEISGMQYSLLLLKVWSKRHEIGEYSGSVQKVVQKIEEAAKTLGKGQIITHKIDLKDNKIMLKWMITEAERLSINLKGSWDLNYKSNQLLLEPSEKVFEKDGLKYQAVEINAGAITTGIRLKITEGSLSDYENSDGNIWLQDFMSDDSKNSVTLKNGQKLSCYKEFFSNDNVTDENTYVIQLMYLSGNDWVTVNPEEIASIEIEGNRITK